MVTQFYHTRDPIANLRVCVTVRKVAVGDSRDGDVPVGTTWSYKFEWQEKQWPFASRKKRQAKSKNRPDSFTQKDGETASPHAASAHHGAALCSYVDADNYEPPPRGPREAPTTALTPPPHIVAAAADYHASQTVANRSHGASHHPHADAPAVGTSNRDRVALRAHREETFRQMHLVLRISDGDNDTEDDRGEDLVLTSMRFYPHTGLLCMTPGFSLCIVDDKDVHAADKGPQLSTFRITSRVSGAQYEYALDNENELWPVVCADDQRLVRELQRQEQLEERARMDEWRNKHGDVSALDAAIHSKRVAPKKEDKRLEEDQMLVLMEIVSVSGIDSADPFRVDVHVPEDPSCDDSAVWRVDTRNQVSRTRLSRVVIRDGGHSFAAFGHHIQLRLSRSMPTTQTATTMHASVPPLTVSVVTLDSWGRERLQGHTELRLSLVPGYTDTELALWQPLLDPRGQMEEFFLGCDGTYADRELTTATDVDQTKSILSRLGSQTVSTSGRVRVRLHVIQSRPQAAKPPAPSESLTLAGMRSTQGGTIVKRSVEEILQAVKANQQGSSVSRSGALPPITAASPNVTAILARLKDQSSRGTSPSAG